LFLLPGVGMAGAAQIELHQINSFTLTDREFLT
jgi:hypothetical protein